MNAVEVRNALETKAMPEAVALERPKVARLYMAVTFNVHRVA